MRAPVPSWPVVVFLLGTAVPCGAAFADNPRVPDDKIFRSGVELVTLNVVVTDPRRRFVSDLEPRDFQVLEDGRPQEIAFFSGSSVPLDLVIVIDTSSSMSVMRPAVRQAATGFLRVLRPEDRAAVIGFSERVSVLQDMTHDVALVATAIAQTGASGSTALYSSLYVVLREFGRPARRADEVRRQAIVVLTDGEENRSALEFDTLLHEARGRGVAVYAIMMQTDAVIESEQRAGRLSPARAGIRQIATETGAMAYFPNDIRELAPIYRTIAEDLAHQYAIAYQPATSGGDENPRRVSVRLVSKPTLRARTRTHYVAGGTLRVASAK